MRILAACTALCGAAAALSNFNIPGWELQAEAKVSGNVKDVSSTGFDSSSWYKIGPRNTVFAGLIEVGLFDTHQLFYSKNLQDTVDYLPYYAPWFYRSEFNLKTGNGTHAFVITNGITSKADIFINGHQIANHTFQAGIYAGHTYDVSKLVRNNNALLIRAYPTLYEQDFGSSWVDWNSYPPDNGTGVWRDVSIKQTGPLFMGPLRIIHDYVPGASSVIVTLRANVTNLESSSMKGIFQGTIVDSVQNRSNMTVGRMSQTYDFDPLETKIIELNATINNPNIWWPKQWGDQPLYTAQASIMAQGQMSDQSPAITFGIRTIVSKLQNHFSDRLFEINGHPFQVRGGGYAPDLFLRWNATQFEAQAQYVLDMGMNTIRLEGKMEQPELYDIADRIGLMIMPGWECCDKWEAWSYNDELTQKFPWSDDDYDTALAMARHEASTMQTHPSILTFLVGSDYWPDEKASSFYIQAFEDYDFPNPIVCSAAKRGWVKALGPSGLKMTGPYDWVPPDYWFNGTRLGSAFGFGSELGSGVGTPEIGSLKQFLDKHELKELWQPKYKDIGLYHMGNNQSSFHTRKIYNKALYNRLGKPTSLDDYLLKAQIMDYEATRAEYEAYALKWNEERPATGLIYWMLNNAWPSLHWNQFDYYLHPAGSYFGTKAGCRIENVAYDYIESVIYLINQSLNSTGARTIIADMIDGNGKSLWNSSMSIDTEPNTSKAAMSVKGLDKIEDVAFLRLILTDSDDNVLSRNVYWLATSLDKMEWHKSSWYSTPVSSYANYTALMNLPTANVSVSVAASSEGSSTVTVANTARVPAFFIRLNLVDEQLNDITPVLWSDNYVTLFPNETLELTLSYNTATTALIEASGANFGSSQKIRITS